MENQRDESETRGSGESFETLTAFANLGDSKQIWTEFLLKNSGFFVGQKSASRSSSLFSDLLRRATQNVAKRNSESEDEVLGPFFSLRDLLRTVWASNDREGTYLSILFGFKKGAELESIRSVLVPFSLSKEQSQNEAFGLPEGEPVVNGVSGEISWRFPTEFQQSLYELMRSRWRAKICPNCGKYFVAEKAALTFCSEGCAHAAKVKRAIEYWNREGKAKRERKMKEKEK